MLPVWAEAVREALAEWRLGGGKPRGPGHPRLSLEPGSPLLCAFPGLPSFTRVSSPKMAPSVPRPHPRIDQLVHTGWVIRGRAQGFLKLVSTGANGWARGIVLFKVFLFSCLFCKYFVTQFYFFFFFFPPGCTALHVASQFPD